jgi:hypothetical protein
MKLHNGMRVKITEHGSIKAFDGRTGTVIRLCSDGHSAWIKTDEPLPSNLRSFPTDDHRCDHTKIYDDECEVA